VLTAAQAGRPVWRSMKMSSIVRLSAPSRSTTGAARRSSTWFSSSPKASPVSSVDTCPRPVGTRPRQGQRHRAVPGQARRWVGLLRASAPGGPVPRQLRMLQEQGVVGDACLPVAGLSRTSDSRAPRAAGLDGVTASEPEKQAGPILITYNGSPAAPARRRPSDVAARRAPRLPLVVWTSGLGRELLELAPVPGLPPAQIDSTRSRRSRGAGRDRTLDRLHGRRHRARRGFGDGGSRCRRAAADRRLRDDRPGRVRARLLRRARRRPRPAPRSSLPRPNGDPAGVGRMPESFIIPFVLIGISVGKGAHRSVERVPGAEIGADRDRVA
jgi:hypothetical protein